MNTTIQARICWLLAFGLLAASAAIRIAASQIAVADYTVFFAHWLSVLAHAPGLSAFATPFSNYPPLYLYLFKVLSLVPVDGLYGIKTLSFIFEAVIAAAAAWMVGKTAPHAHSRGQLLLVFAVMLSIPTLVINGSLWGQVDSVYAAFVLLCLFALLRKRPLEAAILYGVALSFKIQAIFFLPVFFGYFWGDIRRLSYMLILPAVYVISIIPGWLAGGSLPYLLTVYLRQANEYPALNLHSASVFALTQGLQISSSTQELLSCAGIGIAGICALYIAYRTARSPLSDATSLLYLTLLSVTAIPYFLPHMHERYFYLADMFSVIYAFYVPKHWYIPVFIVFSSLIAYGSALLERGDVRLASLLTFLALFVLVVAPPDPVRAAKRY